MVATNEGCFQKFLDMEISKPVEKDDTKFVSKSRRLIDARNAEKVLREWACDCAERALKVTKVKDKRSWDAIKVARLYNEGKATKEELDAAWAAARDAAWTAEVEWQKHHLDELMNKLFEVTN